MSAGRLQIQAVPQPTNSNKQQVSIPLHSVSARLPKGDTFCNLSFNDGSRFSQVISRQINILAEIWTVDVRAGELVAFLSPAESTLLDFAGVDAGNPFVGDREKSLRGRVNTGFE